MAYKNWTPEEETQLKLLAATGKHSFRQIGQIMGRSLASITCHAHQFLDTKNDQYEPRKFEHDRTFFAKPNVVNSYIAGFLAADGCIRQDKKGHWTLRLEVSILDEIHMRWIKDTMKHEGSVHRYDGKGTVLWQMFIDDTYAQDLERNFGVIWHKTHRLQPPNLPTFELRFAYLLGLLDGDGCIHINNLGTLMISYVSSSVAAVEWYQQMVNSFDFPLIRKKGPSLRKLKHASAYGLCYSGARAVCLVQLAQAFARKHSLPILVRKWDNTRLNDYIRDFYLRFPTFTFDPTKLIDSS